MHLDVEVVLCSLKFNSFYFDMWYVETEYLKKKKKQKTKLTLLDQFHENAIEEFKQGIRIAF